MHASPAIGSRERCRDYLVSFFVRAVSFRPVRRGSKSMLHLETSLTSHATDPSDEVAWERRGVKVSHLAGLVNEACRRLELDENHCATSRIESVGHFTEHEPAVCEGLFRGTVFTKTNHRLYKLDQVLVTGEGDDDVTIDSVPALNRAGTSRSTVNGGSWFRPFRSQDPESVRVVQVLCPRSVEVVGSRSQMSGLQGRQLSMPLNMHKLAGELVIPLTTVEERIVHIRDSRDARALIDNLKADRRTLKHPVQLPTYKPEGSTIVIDRGAAIHGSLSPSGAIRKYYWSMGANRIRMWKTRVVNDAGGWHHGRDQIFSDEAPEGWAEAEQWIDTKVIEERAATGGLLLVLRRGVSYSELLHRGQKITEFISHNWAGHSRDLVRTLQVAEVECAWICTMALNQHAIPCLSLKSSPFYRALRNMAGTGRVVMVLDKDASALTRIWCVYEVWESLPWDPCCPRNAFNEQFGSLLCRDVAAQSTF